MIKAIILFMCLAASSISLNASAQDERGYSYGPVTEVDYMQVKLLYMLKERGRTFRAGSGTSQAGRSTNL